MPVSTWNDRRGQAVRRQQLVWSPGSRLEEPMCMCVHPWGPVCMYSCPCACIHEDLCACTHARVRASTGTCVRALMHTLPTARHLHPPCRPCLPAGHCMPLGERAPHPALCGGCPVHLAVVPSRAEAGQCPTCCGPWGQGGGEGRRTGRGRPPLEPLPVLLRL